MKGTLNKVPIEPLTVTGKTLPVGRICSDGIITLLKVSETAILALNKQGQVSLSTDLEGWSVLRGLMPEGTTLTITT